MKLRLIKILLVTEAPSRSSPNASGLSAENSNGATAALERVPSCLNGSGTFSFKREEPSASTSREWWIHPAPAGVWTVEELAVGASLAEIFRARALFLGNTLTNILLADWTIYFITGRKKTALNAMKRGFIKNMSTKKAVANDRSHILESLGPYCSANNMMYHEVTPMYAVMMQ